MLGRPFFLRHTRKRILGFRTGMAGFRPGGGQRGSTSRTRKVETQALQPAPVRQKVETHLDFARFWLACCVDAGSDTAPPVSTNNRVMCLRCLRRVADGLSRHLSQPLSCRLSLPPAASWQRATGVVYPRAATGLCRGSRIFNGSVGAVGGRAL